MVLKAAETNFDNLTVGQPTTLPANRGDVSIEGNMMAAGSVLTPDTTTAGNPSPGAALMLYKAVPITAAEIIAMFTTPKTLIAAPGLNKTIVVHKVMLRVTRTSTQFTGGGTVVANYATGPVAAINTIPAANITGAAGIIDASRAGIDAANVENDAIVLTNATAVFATGTGTAVAHIWYSIV